MTGILFSLYSIYEEEQHSKIFLSFYISVLAKELDFLFLKKMLLLLTTGNYLKIKASLINFKDHLKAILACLK